MTNTVRLRGVIRDPFYLEEREDGGTCYVTYVSIMRNSGISDTLQVVILPQHWMAKPAIVPGGRFPSSANSAPETVLTV